jgi:hypothetical protein
MGLLFNVFLAVFAATGSFLFGYDSGVMTIVIKSPNFLHYFNTTTASATMRPSLVELSLDHSRE